MCTNCGNTQNPYAVYNVQYVYKNECTDCNNGGCETTLRAGCAFYTSANLPNSGILTNDSVEVALQKIDAQLAAVTGSYAGYNIGCLGPAGSITTEAAFVQAITTYACTLRTDLNNFTNNTFTGYQGTVNNRFIALEVPGIVHAGSNVGVTDNLNTVLNKFGLKFNSLDAAVSLTGVNWSQCFAVGSVPTTIAQGFSLLVDQICQVKNSGGSVSLPTFNNVGSVLSAPGATDSLEATVIKLRDRLALVPTLDINAYAWNSVTKPAGSATNLQGTLAAILAKLDNLSQNMVLSFDSGDFTETAVDAANIFAGKRIALAASLNMDRFVAVDGSDTTPGTLIQKLQAGAGVTLDTATVPGKILISATNVGSDGKVKADAADTAPGYLSTKVKGGTTDHITTATFYDAADKKVQVNATLNMTTVIDAILTAAETDAAIKARLCAILATCPNPCAAPQNVQVTAV